MPKAASSKNDCTGICHYCLAGRPGFDYEDVCLFLLKGCVALVFGVSMLLQEAFLWWGVSSNLKVLLYRFLKAA